MQKNGEADGSALALLEGATAPKVVNLSVPISPMIEPHAASSGPSLPVQLLTIVPEPVPDARGNYSFYTAFYDYYSVSYFEAR